MVQARIERGRVKLRDPLPAQWEGQLVNITPTTPGDPLPDLEERLAVLHRMGPMEFDPGEKSAIAEALAELDQISNAAMAANPRSPGG
jgi:hypothetical protein